MPQRVPTIRPGMPASQTRAERVLATNRRGRSNDATASKGSERKSEGNGSEERVLSRLYCMKIRWEEGYASEDIFDRAANQE